MNKMTIFYQKTDGRIISMCSWVQSFDMFRENERDIMIQTCDILIIDQNDDVANNPMNYMVIDGELKLKEGTALNKYITD